MENKNEKRENIAICGKIIELAKTESAKFNRDFETVKAILSKPAEDITAVDRMILLSIYRPAYHESGKIEGVTSYDSTASNCDFCRAMREAAKNNPSHICGYCYDYAQEHFFRGANIVNRHGYSATASGRGRLNAKTGNGAIPTGSASSLTKTDTFCTMPRSPGRSDSA